MVNNPDGSVAPKKQFRIPVPVRQALLVFGLVSAVILASIPHLAAHSKTPPFWIFLVTGLVMIALTGGLFFYLDRLKLGFSRSALVMIFGYNAVIAIIKFILSPAALYAANSKNSFSALLGDPNSVLFFIPVAAAILLLYVTVFALLYRYIRHHQAVLQAGVTAIPESKRRLRKGILIVCLGILGTVLTGGIVLLIPIIVLGSSVSYLSYVIGALGTPVLVAILLAIMLAQRSFEAVQLTAVKTGNATLLASFFWLGLSLILLFHILWIIFMLTLVQIWPFNTYSPK